MIVAKMTHDEYRRFLTERPYTMTVATAQANGSPHVAPVWFDVDGETIVFTTWWRSVKARNIQRDPRVCLCVNDDTPPFSFATIEGRAQVIEDLDELRRWAARIGGKYMGSGRADEYGERNGVAGELLVRVTPTKIVAEKNIAE